MRSIFFLLIVLILVACSGGADETLSEEVIQTAIAQTQVAQPSVEHTPTAESPIDQPPPTNTPRPTNKPPEPTKTHPPTTEVDASGKIAKNYLASQDSGGVIIEIARVLVAEKRALPGFGRRLGAWTGSGKSD